MLKMIMNGYAAMKKKKARVRKKKKTFEKAQKEVKKEFMKRNWNTEQYWDVYGVMLKYIEKTFFKK